MGRSHFRRKESLPFISLGLSEHGEHSKENNSREKSEEHASCTRTSVEAEEAQGTSGEAEKAKNSAQGAKRKRDTKNSTGKRATVPQIVFPWV